MNLNRHIGHFAFNNIFELLYKKDETYVRMHRIFGVHLNQPETYCNFWKYNVLSISLSESIRAPEHLNRLCFALVKWRQLWNSACGDSYVVHWQGPTQQYIILKWEQKACFYYAIIAITSLQRLNSNFCLCRTRWLTRSCYIQKKCCKKVYLINYLPLIGWKYLHILQIFTPLKHAQQNTI